MSTLDTTLNKASLVDDNSLEANIEKVSIVRRIGDHVKGVYHATANSIRVIGYIGLAAAVILTITAKKLDAKTVYIRPAQGVKSTIDNVVNNEIRVPEDYTSIQAAINDANNGDEIIVELGTYYENINFKGKNIVLRSTDSNDLNIVANTVINGMRKSSVATFQNGEDPNCVLSGFTITNGRAHLGGGVYYTESIAYSRGPKITNCIFNNNSGEYGGGMYIDGTMTIENCIFRGNFAEVLGGGVIANNSVLRNCNFVGNFAGSGGGLVSEGTSPTLVNCVFTNNSAIWGGGGIYQNVGYPVLTNCVFYKNSASEGGGMYAFDCSPVLTNCIIFGNSPNQLYALDGDLLVRYSDVQGGWPGEGNIDVDPCFAEPGRWDDDVCYDGDYHLKSQAGRWDPNKKEWVLDGETSPCIDAGDPSSPIMYEPFPNGGIINMGAYGGTLEASKSYFGEPLCETIVAGDINGDCKIDFRDFAFMANNWLRIIDSNYYLPPGGE